MRMQTMLGSLTPADVRARSASVWELLAQVEEFRVAQCISVYVSVGAEIETHGLIRQLLAMERRVCAPAFDGARYRLAEVRDFDVDLVAGEFGIFEPRNGPVVPADQPDAWLVPGLAFDVKGNRLGRGQGFYDALLREARGAKIALAHDFQILSEVPASQHDVRMDFIVTETRLINCQRK
jgi:5-formyltetrahydrofolate cyclo-ligase